MGPAYIDDGEFWGIGFKVLIEFTLSIRCPTLYMYRRTLFTLPELTASLVKVAPRE
ncbi:hypothetical protein KIN20_017321 [Parelaphostrongylus tenuis]|uniref:Uncharacterized protein n=1 Tax=Parelaphostrongylus tenuis TaxID=148309 RepID=A0AAD5MHT6_PARTN|nr:hypothetical protein KIN20_017321 [Parelaphostrongylus tenuis]